MGMRGAMFICNRLASRPFSGMHERCAALITRGRVNTNPACHPATEAEPEALANMYSVGAAPHAWLATMRTITWCFNVMSHAIGPVPQLQVGETARLWACTRSINGMRCVRHVSAEIQSHMIPAVKDSTSTDGTQT